LAFSSFWGLKTMVEGLAVNVIAEHDGVFGPSIRAVLVINAGLRDAWWVRPLPLPA